MKYRIAAVLSLAMMLSACGTDTESTTGTVVTETATETGTTETETSVTTVALSTVTESTAESSKTEKKTTETAASETEAETQAPAETEAPQEDERPAETEAPAAPQNDPPQQQETQEKTIWDQLKIGASPADYISANSGYTRDEADSCMGPGKDINYTYSDRVLICYTEGGPEKLVELNLTASGIKTRKGIEVGSSVADVEAAYGPADATGRYLFDTEDGQLEFLTADGAVTMIALY